MSAYSFVLRLIKENPASTAAQLVTASKGMVDATAMAHALIDLTQGSTGNPTPPVAKTGSGAGATYAAIAGRS